MEENNERHEYLKRIKETEQKYYSKHSKNVIFKNSQKSDCASFVTNEMDLQRMIDCTAFIVPDTNIIYYNYLVFKTYGNEENHIHLYTHLTQLITTVLHKYNTFEFHINLKTFSVSACQRYYNMIVGSIDDNMIFTEKMTKIVIYHTPFIIDQINKLLYNSIRTFVDKVEYVKKDSDLRINKLFNITI